MQQLKKFAVLEADFNKPAGDKTVNTARRNNLRIKKSSYNNITKKDLKAVSFKVKVVHEINKQTHPCPPKPPQTHPCHPKPYHTLPNPPMPSQTNPCPPKTPAS